MKELTDEQSIEERTEVELESDEERVSPLSLQRLLFSGLLIQLEEVNTNIKTLGKDLLTQLKEANKNISRMRTIMENQIPQGETLTLDITMPYNGRHILEVIEEFQTPPWFAFTLYNKHGPDSVRMEINRRPLADADEIQLDEMRRWPGIGFPWIKGVWLFVQQGETARVRIDSIY